MSLTAGGLLECLACGYENKAADKFCAQCASSLDLKLCRVCEAVNANGDASCYKCGAELLAAPQVPVSVQGEAKVSDPTSPAYGLSTSRHVAKLFAVPIVLLAGTVALFDGMTFSSRTEVPSIASAQAPEPRAEPSHPVESSGSDGNAQTVAEVPKASSVTHTRVSPAATTFAPRAMQKRAGVAAVGAGLGPEPASEKGEEPAVVRASMMEAPAFSRVTHTKAQQPARTAARTQKLDAGEEQPAGCAPGVVALGLCK